MRKSALIAVIALTGMVMTVMAAGPDISMFKLELGPSLQSQTELPPASDWVAGEETLHWDGEPDRGMSIATTYSYGLAQRHTAGEEGLQLNAIIYYLMGNADAIFVFAAGHGTPVEPGPVLDTTRATGLGGGVWRRANLPKRPLIEPYEDFWTCVIVRRHPAGQSPLSLDLGPIVPFRGGYINLPEIGPQWFQLTDPPFWGDFNVSIRAIVEGFGSGVEEVYQPDYSAELGLQHRVWPNPMHSNARFSYQVRKPGPVSLEIYDAVGNKVRTVVNETAQPGEHFAAWDCRDESGRRVSAGTYLYRLRVGDESVTGRAVVLD